MNNNFNSSNLPERGNNNSGKQKRKAEVDPLAIKKRKKWPIVLTIVGGIILAIAVYVFVFLNFYKPSTDDDAPPFVIHETDEDGNTVTPTKTTDTKYNFLVMGHDRVAGLTDVIMLVSYDTDKQSVSIMQIPRDTYVELDDYYYHKINGAYSYYVGIAKDEKSAHPEIDGSRKFADLLQKSLNIKIHYTAVMDLDGFSSIVDAVGGVDMYVPLDMYYVDPKQNLYINLKEGYQHLDGDTAEQFVRCRSVYANADLGRGDAQKLFMTAFIKKLKDSVSLADVGTLTTLAGNVASSVTTDLSASDILFFGKSFIGFGGKPSVNLENVNLLTMPGQSFFDELSYYMINKDAVTSVINEYFNIYNIDIKAGFDSDKTFVNESNSGALATYNKPKEELDMTIYNGEKLDEDGLN